MNNYHGYKFKSALYEILKDMVILKPINQSYVDILRYEWSLTNDPKYLKLAIKNGCSKSSFDLANFYNFNDNMKLAIKYFNESIMNKNVDAMVMLGMIYKNNGSPKCIPLFKLAFNFGIIKASAQIADYYERKGDIKTMIKYLKIGIDNNDGLAMLRLGLYYAGLNDKNNCEGLNNNDENNRNALFYYNLAFDAGESSSIDFLSSYYEINGLDDKFIEIHEKNIVKEIKKNNKSVTNDNSTINNIIEIINQPNIELSESGIDSLNELANFYYNSEEHLNEEYAIKLYKKASEFGQTAYGLVNHLLQKRDKELEYYYNKYNEEMTEGKLLDETHGKILNVIGNFYFNDGETDKAIIIYDKSIKFENTDSIYDLAQLYKSIGDYENYIKNFDLAINKLNERAIDNKQEYKDFIENGIQNDDGKDEVMTEITLKNKSIYEIKPKKQISINNSRFNPVKNKSVKPNILKKQII